MLDYGNTEKIKVFGLGALCLCEKYNKTICNYRFSLYSPYFPVYSVTLLGFSELVDLDKLV